MQSHPTFTIESELPSYPGIGHVIGALGLQETLLVNLLATTFPQQKSSGITEIALLKISRKGRAFGLSTLINPENPISLYVANSLGISEADVADAFNWPAFLKKSGYHWLKYSLSGFNIRHYDKPYIEDQNKRYNITYTLSAKVIDIKQICMSLHPGTQGTLNHYCALYGLGDTAKHRAMPQALLTARLFEALIDAHGAAAVVALLTPHD